MDGKIHKSEVAAVVVLYNPPADVLDNIHSYIRQVDVVIAVDNTPDLDASFRAELESRGVEYLSMGGNKGIAAALNAGCRRAIDSGHSWALTMDQDSTAPEGFVDGLAKCLESADSDRIAIIAPKWEQAGGLTEEKVAECRDLVSAMTSGNLLRLSAFSDLGGFREDLFIDRVDNELCMHALRNGWRVTQRQDVVLLHRCGTLQLVTFPIRCYITDYSPVRRYYMVRNFFELRAEYGKEFPTWLDEERRYWRKELVKILLAEPKRLAKVKMMLRGWVDYRRRRFGSYDDLHSS